MMKNHRNRLLPLLLALLVSTACARTRGLSQQKPSLRERPQRQAMESIVTLAERRECVPTSEVTQVSAAQSSALLQEGCSPEACAGPTSCCRVLGSGLFCDTENKYPFSACVCNDYTRTRSPSPAPGTGGGTAPSPTTDGGSNTGSGGDNTDGGSNNTGGDSNTGGSNNDGGNNTGGSNNDGGSNTGGSNNDGGSNTGGSNNDGGSNTGGSNNDGGSTGGSNTGGGTIDGGTSGGNNNGDFQNDGSTSGGNSNSGTNNDGVSQINKGAATVQEEDDWWMDPALMGSVGAGVLVLCVGVLLLTAKFRKETSRQSRPAKALSYEADNHSEASPRVEQHVELESVQSDYELNELPPDEEEASRTSSSQQQKDDKCCQVQACNDFGSWMDNMCAPKRARSYNSKNTVDL